MSTPAYVSIQNGPELYTRTDGYPENVIEEVWQIMQRVGKNSKNWVRDFCWEAKGYLEDHGEMRGARSDYDYRVFKDRGKLYIELEENDYTREFRGEYTDRLRTEITPGSPRPDWDDIERRRCEAEEEGP